MTSETLLELKNIKVHYGGVKALDGANVAIDEGEIVALMGPNGAGKSTILKAIFGLAPIETGSVWWQGQTVRPVAHEMVARGLAFVPQGRRVFKQLTVRENLEVGGYIIKDKKEIARRLEAVIELFPILRHKLEAKSDSLSGGQQQMLALARGLMTAADRQRSFCFNPRNQRTALDGDYGGGAQHQVHSPHRSPRLCAGAGENRSRRRAGGIIENWPIGKSVCRRSD